jgi:hypothetical protein
MDVGIVKDVGTVARNDLAVKLDAELVTKAKHVVITRRGRGEKLTIAEYLSGLLKPLVDRDYETEFNPAKKPKGGAK